MDFIFESIYNKVWANRVAGASKELMIKDIKISRDIG